MNAIEILKEYTGRRVDNEVYRKIDAAASEVEKEVKCYPDRRTDIENQMITVLREMPMYEEYFTFYVSAMLCIFERPQYLELLLEGALCNENLTLQNLDYIWHNAENFLMKHPQCETAEIKAIMQKVQAHLYQELRNSVTVHYKEKDAREKNRVIVMAGNFVGERHAPSHSALERCYMLEDRMGAEVYLVSNKEGAHASDFYPYYKGVSANIRPEHDDTHLWKYRDREFRFYQESKPVNTPEGLQELIDVVEHMNPYYIVYVGTESYVADIINEFCPVISISVTFSKLRNFHTAFAMVGRTVTEAERAAHPYEIIEVPFSFELREKKGNHSREELGIPKNVFVMAVVGMRLDFDVQDEFLACMEQLSDTYLLFVGIFNTYAQKIVDYPRLREHSLCTGMVDDVVGILECADLYVNPKRIGGGFSVIEGFHAGIPAVTINYGDVAAAAGELFCVKDYDEMQETIRRYQNDAVFYQEMLKAGKEREKFITNGGEVFERGIMQMLDSEKFY